MQNSSDWHVSQPSGQSLGWHTRLGQFAIDPPRRLQAIPISPSDWLATHKRHPPEHVPLSQGAPQICRPPSVSRPQSVMSNGGVDEASRISHAPASPLPVSLCATSP
jgi:hypothetical protein